YLGWLGRVTFLLTPNGVKLKAEREKPGYVASTLMTSTAADPDYYIFV
ncbi:unnamed protein product, partial [marine sediment metagenome]